jgi:putative ABC transport system permease protein
MKEFGIRKVLGATIRQIASLQINYFLRLAIIANVIALPLAWWLMNVWLQRFAYRIQLDPLFLLYVGLGTSLLVALSSMYAGWKAGKMNPVDVISKNF